MSNILMALYQQADNVEELLATTELDLCEAVAAGRNERVSTILTHDPSALQRHGFDGWTPLHLAAFLGNLVGARQLLEAGADVRARAQNAQANEPLHAGVAGRRNVGLLTLLLDHGADVNARAPLGVTPLHLAAARGDQQLVELFVSRGADLRACSDDGKQAADYATEREHPSVASWLRQH